MPPSAPQAADHATASSARGRTKHRHPMGAMKDMSVSSAGELHDRLHGDLGARSEPTSPRGAVCNGIVPDASGDRPVSGTGSLGHAGPVTSTHSNSAVSSAAPSSYWLGLHVGRHRSAHDAVAPGGLKRACSAGATEALRASPARSLRQSRSSPPSALGGGGKKPHQTRSTPRPHRREGGAGPGDEAAVRPDDGGSGRTLPFSLVALAHRRAREEIRCHS